uniref:Uncharacterized protein n=1 Tax=viral metagenome TaxID=1070528 RepID=A0A6C0EPY3_9ZZZZ
MTETRVMNHIYANNQNNSVLNKGFILLDTLFKENGWYNFINDMDRVAYTRVGYETEYFEIKIDENKIHVSIPIKNSKYQYKTHFNNYFQASEYVEEYFKQYIVF